MQVYDQPVKLVWNISYCIYFFLIAALGVIKKNCTEQALKYNSPQASFKTSWVFFYGGCIRPNYTCMESAFTQILGTNPIIQFAVREARQH